MESRNISDSVSHWIASIVQNIGTIFFRILFHIFFKIKIHNAEWLQVAHGPALIVSNHIAPYDSFMFHLFYKIGSPLLPLRFMGVLKFHIPFLNFLSKIGVISIIYKLFGVFVIVQGEGIEKALTPARRLVKQGRTVVIFPEGRISRDSQIGEFKKGAALLAAETEVQVIPVSVKKISGKFRSTIHINVGPSMKFNQTMSANEITDILRKNIIELHSQYPQY